MRNVFIIIILLPQMQGKVLMNLNVVVVPGWLWYDHCLHS